MAAANAPVEFVIGGVHLSGGTPESDLVHRFGGSGMTRPGSEEFRMEQTTEVIVRTNIEIEDDVKGELKWEPDLDATDISVKVDNGGR